MISVGIGIDLTGNGGGDRIMSGQSRETKWLRGASWEAVRMVVFRNNLYLLVKHLPQLDCFVCASALARLYITLTIGA